MSDNYKYTFPENLYDFDEEDILSTIRNKFGFKCLEGDEKIYNKLGPIKYGYYKLFQFLIYKLDHDKEYKNYCECKKLIDDAFPREPYVFEI